MHAVERNHQCPYTAYHRRPCRIYTRDPIAVRKPQSTAYLSVWSWERDRVVVPKKIALNSPQRPTKTLQTHSQPCAGRLFFFFFFSSFLWPPPTRRLHPTIELTPCLSRISIHFPPLVSLPLSLSLSSLSPASACKQHIHLFVLPIHPVLPTHAAVFRL